mmetsp:Transcript_20651/g.69938  ORF Transcript_20651/g.69938 Transcript_20651/m.69938 type:complete len:244 (-) Transcript_20651:606-1337(-)
MFVDFSAPSLACGAKSRTYSTRTRHLWPTQILRSASRDSSAHGSPARCALAFAMRGALMPESETRSSSSGLEARQTLSWSPDRASTTMASNVSASTPSIEPATLGATYSRQRRRRCVLACNSPARMADAWSPQSVEHAGSTILARPALSSSTEMLPAAWTTVPSAELPFLSTPTRARSTERWRRRVSTKCLASAANASPATASPLPSALAAFATRAARTPARPMFSMTISGTIKTRRFEPLET